MPTDPEASVACGMLILERVLDILNIILGKIFFERIFCSLHDNCKEETEFYVFYRRVN